MKRITKECLNRLNEVPLRTLLPVSGEGATLHGKCPKCGKEGKVKRKWQGLYVRDDDYNRKHYAGCTSCGFKAGGGAVNIMMRFHDVEFPEACEMIANATGIQLSYEQDKDQDNETMDPTSFCSRQLEASGLTYEDVMANVTVNGTEVKVSPFRKGSLNIRTGSIDFLADEMLILYYDIEGRRKMCLPAGAKTKEVGYTRIRFSNPDAQADKYNKPVKYMTIAGAKTELYIPEKIRAKYKARQTIETLFIQEGEKKAEKACKHGIDSIAIQGIGNIGSKETGLPMELQYLVQKCSVKNIVFLMDADWCDLNKDLRDKINVDYRPKSFARAVIKFKKFIGTLWQCGIDVDIWYGHVNSNDAGDKGVDDILCNTLKGKENELLEDICDTMLSHDGKGTYVDLMNITSWSDNKIMDLWHLNDREKFFNFHRERLESLHIFKFGDVFYRVSDNGFEVDSEMGTGKEFWKSWTDDKQKKHVECDLIYMKSFLGANGFRKIRKEDGKKTFCRIKDGIIEECDEDDIRCFVLRHVYNSTSDHDVKLYFTETISTKLSVPNLYQLDYIVTTNFRGPNDQKFFFSDAEVIVSDKDIHTDNLTGPVFIENTIQRHFTRIPVFRTFEKVPGGFDISLTDDGRNCEFLRFLINSSKIKGNSQDEELWHLANKISAIGYLLRDYKYVNETKTVIAMDADMTEVGKSKGRTGKSLIGAAISKFINQVSIDGRNLSTDDQFLLSGVTKKTRNVFIDDIKENFNFANFYQRITGDLNINIKMGARFTIDFVDAPKFYITTNHAIDNIDDSARARIVFMSFSPWYSADHTPFDEFGHNFFQDWDEYQWSLFDNLMLECLMVYMRSRACGWPGHGLGAINPPMENLRKRELRQKMGETFLYWAEIYFAPDAGHINQRITRKTLTDRYLADCNIKMITPQVFKDRLVAFCEYSGLHLNANKRSAKHGSYIDFIRANPGKSYIGDRDSAGGIEYFSVTTTEFNDNDNLQIYEKDENT